MVHCGGIERTRSVSLCGYQVKFSTSKFNRGRYSGIAISVGRDEPWYFEGIVCCAYLLASVPFEICRCTCS